MSHIVRVNRSAYVVVFMMSMVAMLAISPSPAQVNKIRASATGRALSKKAAGAHHSDGSLFFPAQIYNSGGYEANSVAIADLNGDGKLDLVVANSAACAQNCGTGNGVVGVLIGNGDGTFQSVVGYDTGGVGAISVAVADVNGDGKPDLIVANQGLGTGTAAVLLGNGDGTFQTAVLYSLIGPPPLVEADGIAMADVNGDGKLDMLVSLYGSQVDVLLGNGDGTFQAPAIYGPGCCGQGSVTVADVNGDGKPDLLVTKGNSDAVGVMLGNGDGTFKTEVDYDSGAVVPMAVAVADVNGDGKLDLLVANEATSWTDGFPSGPGSATVLLGNGDGTFQPAIGYPADIPNYRSIQLADVNGDGHLDLLLAGCSGSFSWYCANGGDGSLAVMLGNGDGTFQPAVFFDSGGVGAVSLAVGDLDRDGKPDVVLANWAGSNGNPTVGTVGILRTASSGPAPTSTSLSSSGNPCLKPCGVTFTAVVTSAAGTPTGTVSFSDDEPRFLGTATLSNGVASVAPGGFHHGTHLITAVYNGSPDFAPSTSPVLDQEVYEQPVPTQTYVSTSGSPSFVGQPVTFSAGVSPSRGAIPDGQTLTFYDGHKPLGTVPMTNERASLTTSSLNMGEHTILVKYDGNALYEKSHGTVAQIVVKYSTTTTLVSSVNPSVSGQPVTMTVIVTSAGPQTPTGAVTLKGFGTLTLVGGTASATKSNFKVGSHSLTAKYKGDDLSAASTSEILVQVVNPD
ncbi:MAG: FG-GAP-like repeat-containing protein [Terriglobales bacterium]